MSPTNNTFYRPWIGHVITLIFAGLGLAFSYGAMDSRINDLEHRVNNMDSSLVPLMHSLREDINDVKVKVAEIGVDVRWLKTSSPLEK